MKEYYIIVKEVREGPFSYEELKTKSIWKKTLVWEESFENWKEASDVPELKDLLKKSPPPIPINKKKSPPPIPGSEKIPPPIPQKSQILSLNIKNEGLFNNVDDSHETKDSIHEESKLTGLPEESKEIFSDNKGENSNSFFKSEFFETIVGMGIFLLIFLFFYKGCSSNSVEVTEDECKELVNNLGIKIVKTAFDGGSNIIVENKGCEASDSEIRLKFYCKFNGNLIKSNEYSFYAYANIKWDGSCTVEFKQMNYQAKLWYYDTKNYATDKLRYDDAGFLLTQPIRRK